jgi:hypothetical protein
MYRSLIARIGKRQPASFNFGLEYLQPVDNHLQKSKISSASLYMKYPKTSSRFLSIL